jgi:hypothetical protein
MNQLEKRKALKQVPPLEVLLLLSLGDPTNWTRVHQMRDDLANETPSILDAWILAQKTRWFGWLLFTLYRSLSPPSFFFCPTTLNCIFKANNQKVSNCWMFCHVELDSVIHMEISYRVPSKFRIIFFVFWQWASLIGPSQKNSENLEAAQV